MAIKGSLREASLPDVLQLLAMGKKSGCLGVTHRGNFGYIYFAEGRITHASIVNRRDRVSELLAKSGTMPEPQLRAAVEAVIEEAVYLMFTWHEGTFNFEAGVQPESQSLLVSISPESLMLEGARRVDEWSVIETTIPSFDVVFEADWGKLATDKPELTTEQQTVLQHLDGRRDVGHVAEACGLAEFEVGKALYGLVTAGLINRLGTTTKTRQPAPTARADEHRNLGVAFYRSSMYDEALREFRRVLELNNEDSRALFYVGLVLLRQEKWAEAIEAYQSAVARPDAKAGAFHNLAIALERVGRHADALPVLQEASKRSGGTDPRIQTSIGVALLLSGDVPGADAAFVAARPLWRAHPTGAWYHYAALAAVMAGDLHRAQDVLIEGLGHYSHAAVLHNNLAVLLERRSAYDDALARGELGVAEDPALPQLHKNIGDLYYRAGRYDEASEAYERAVRADERHGGDVYLRLGNIRLRRGQRDQAAAAWQKALELDPENVIIRGNLETLKRVPGAGNGL